MCNRISVDLIKYSEYTHFLVNLIPSILNDSPKLSKPMGYFGLYHVQIWAVPVPLTLIAIARDFEADILLAGCPCCPNNIKAIVTKSRKMLKFTLKTVHIFF